MLIVDREVDYCAPLGLQEEEAAFDRFCAARSPRMQVHVWRQSPCIVTTAPFKRRPGFAAAADASAARGWPVHVRRSGGTAVFHAPGVLCVTILSARSAADLTIERAYADFVAGLIDACAGCGVQAVGGSAPAAPCDGRFNLLVDGRKLAGTAMRMRAVGLEARLLAHAALFVDDPAPGLAAVERFERAIGLRVSYPPHACISLTEACPTRADRRARFVRAITSAAS